MSFAFNTHGSKGQDRMRSLWPFSPMNRTSLEMWCSRCSHSLLDSKALRSAPQNHLRLVKPLRPPLPYTIKRILLCSFCRSPPWPGPGRVPSLAGTKRRQQNRIETSRVKVAERRERRATKRKDLIYTRWPRATRFRRECPLAKSSSKPGRLGRAPTRSLKRDQA